MRSDGEGAGCAEFPETPVFQAVRTPGIHTSMSTSSSRCDGLSRGCSRRAQGNIIDQPVPNAKGQKLVIINADDLGWSEGVNVGIFRAHREGIVSSATLAANMPAAEAALAALKETPGFGVGVHLNACQGPPLSAMGLEVLAGPDGLMRSTAMRIVWRSVSRPHLLWAIAAEFDAQIRWCLERGLRPTHADTHRHLHYAVAGRYCIPGVFHIVAGLCRRYDIRFVRRLRERLPRDLMRTAPAKQRLISRALTLQDWWNRRWAGSLFVTEGTLGIAHTGLIDAAWLIRAAQAVRQGVTEIMVHPGLPDGLDPAQTRLLESRQMELAALCDPAVRAAFASQGIQLVHYGQIRTNA